MACILLIQTITEWTKTKGITCTGLKGGWASILKPPTDRDIRGKRRGHKALDAPKRSFDYLVVLDFEWTADKKKGSTVTHCRRSTSTRCGVMQTEAFDLGWMCDVQVYVKPTINPILTDFIKELTAITQEQ
eukprot:3976981-Pyramimonas_sp.AAC.1